METVCIQSGYVCVGYATVHRAEVVLFGTHGQSL